MQYRTFGRRTGLRVSELALGTGNFGTRWGHGAEPAEAKRMFDRYAEAGGNFIDSADIYQFGEAETLVGEFIAADRDHFVVATKYSMGATPEAGISRTGNGRRNMLLAVEDSLRRLKTDRIDLLWVHAADGLTPTEEIVRGLDDLVRAGKIVHAGLSNFPAWRVARADAMAELRGWAPLVGIQVEYSLAERGAERELLPMAEALGLGATLWSPLGGGLLTGKYRKGEEGGRLAALGKLVRTEQSERVTAVVDAVLAVAEEARSTPTHVAIAWLRARAAASATALVPILGPRSAAQLEATLGALTLQLQADQLARLEAASAFEAGAPYDQIASSLAGTRGGHADIVAPRVPVA